MRSPSASSCITTACAEALGKVFALSVGLPFCAAGSCGLAVLAGVLITAYLVLVVIAYVCAARALWAAVRLVF